MTTIAASDPYQPYASIDNSGGKGKGHPPIVPEASSYGLFFVGIALAALFLSRYLNRRIIKSL